MTKPDKVPFADLALQWRQIRARALPDLEALFESSAFCLGPWVEAFERDAATYLGVKHAIAVNSGTSALHLAMIAAGIKAGDKVLAPAQTFVGTVWGALYEKAVPVLCDVELASNTLDPQELERRFEDGVKAVLPVHLFGQPANMDAILDFARRRKIKVIEDAAQAFGAQYGGRKLGSLGDMGCFSFYPGKNLGGAGEGGMVVTQDDETAARLRALRNHGQSKRYVHEVVGFNYRMDGIQGLILGHKLPLLDGWTNERRAIASRYTAALAGLPLELPQVVHGDHVWHLYVVRTPQRDALRAHLEEQGVESGLHYPVPLHLQPVLDSYKVERDAFPNATRWANEGLSLPVFAGMTDAQQDRVIAAVKGYFSKE